MATLKVTNIKNESFAGDQLYLKTDGKIGIGTTSPSSTLDVNGIIGINNPSITTDAKLIVKGNDTNNHDIITAYANTSTRGSFAIRTGTGVSPSFLIGTRGGSETLGLMTNATERMRIDGSGNVGIGTTSPTSKIDIHCGSDNTGLQITSTDAGAFASYFDNTGASSIGHSGTDLTLSCDPAGSVGNSNIVFQVDANNERMRIDGSGRLLIGTTTEGHSNGDDLTIATSGNTGITIRSGSSSNGNIFFSDATSGAGEYEGMIWYAHGTNSMRFATSQTERLQIGSDGTVTVESEDLVFGTTGKGIEFPNSVSIKQNVSNLYVNLASGNNNVEVQSNGTSFVKFRGTNGNVELVNGNLVLSTAGKGIDFSATSDGPSQGNETLDDYERGTYTPQGLSWNGSSWVNVTFDAISRYGRYTKIGGYVHVQGYFSNFHVDSSFDNTLAGISLPFTPINATGMYSVGVTTHSTAFSTAGYTTFFVNSTGSSHMYSMQENTTSYNTWSGSSGRYLMFQASYMCE